MANKPHSAPPPVSPSWRPYQRHPRAIDDAKHAYLQALGQTGRIIDALQHIGLKDWSKAREWRQSDREFAQAESLILDSLKGQEWHERQEIYLKALASCGRVGRARMFAGIGEDRLKTLRQQDRKFAEAEAEVKDRLRREGPSGELEVTLPSKSLSPEEQREAYLEAYSRLGNRSAATMEVGIRSVNTIYQWRTKYPDFRAADDAANLRWAEANVDPDLADDPMEEWAKDRIDLRRVTTEYPRHMPPRQSTLIMDYIENRKLRDLVKRYWRLRIAGGLAASTAVSYQNEMQFVWQFFNAFYPSMGSFAQLTRPIVEELITMTHYTAATGSQHLITDSIRLRGLSSLRGMLEYMIRMDWAEAPKKLVLFEEDYPRQRGRWDVEHIKSIPRDVLGVLLANTDRLPPYARNAVHIMAVTGLRGSDCLQLLENCLERDAVGDPRLVFTNHKMKREGRKIPVNEFVVEAIQRQQQLVKEIPAVDGQLYLFRMRERKIYRRTALYKALNDLARQVPVLGEDGKPFRFAPHKFRHTVGTEMINTPGVGIADVMAYLDHASPEMTLRYAKIQDRTLKEKFKQTVLSGIMTGGKAFVALRDMLERGDETELDWVISNLRRQSLPFGYCLHHAKAPVCPHANACFTAGNGSPCSKLVTTTEFLPALKQTLIQVEENMEVAKAKGWDQENVWFKGQEMQARGIRQVVTNLVGRSDGGEG